MIDYTEYDPQTGCITGGGFHPDTMPPNAIAGNWSGVNYYVSNGKAVPFPQRPSDWHDFDFSKKSWVLNVEHIWRDVRSKRDSYLERCDWTTLPDVPLSDTQRAAWAAYRQALRDITEQVDPLRIKWPDLPQ